MMLIDDTLGQYLNIVWPDFLLPLWFFYFGTSKNDPECIFTEFRQLKISRRVMKSKWYYSIENKTSSHKHTLYWRYRPSRGFTHYGTSNWPSLHFSSSSNGRKSITESDGRDGIVSSIENNIFSHKHTTIWLSRSSEIKVKVTGSSKFRKWPISMSLSSDICWDTHPEYYWWLWYYEISFKFFMSGFSTFASFFVLRDLKIDPDCIFSLSSHGLKPVTDSRERD